MSEVLVMAHEEILALARSHKDKISLNPTQIKIELEELTKKYIDRFGSARERLESKQ